MRVEGINSRQSRRIRGVTAQTSAAQCILRAMRLIENRSDLMVVPSIGIVVHDSDRGAAPLGPGLQEVDYVDQESLLIQRIGITGMPVLVSRGLEEAHCREIACLDRGIKVVQVIIMVRGRSEEHTSE